MLSRLASLRSSSLLQCRSISKRWRCTTSSDPITFHNQISFKESPDSVFVAEPSDDYENSVLIDKKGTISTRIPHWSAHDFSLYLPMSNSCNGLILVPNESDDYVYLFNPSTEYFTRVFDLNLIDSRIRKEGDHFTTLGLYYDASINDYKALISLTHKYSEDHICALASLKEGYWSEINFPFYPRDVEQGPLLHGRLHWIVYRLDDPNSESNIIACFNPNSNAFEIFPSPPHKKGIKILGLGVIEGCLWMARYSSEDQLVDVLKMEEYGVAESWTSMFVLPKFEEDLTYCDSFVPLFITENGQVLFSKYEPYSGEMLAYDPETNSCTKLCESFARGLQMVPFVKTLASPDEDN